MLLLKLRYVISQNVSVKFVPRFLILFCQSFWWKFYINIRSMSDYQQLFRYEHVNVNIPYAYNRPFYHTARLRRMVVSDNTTEVNIYIFLLCYGVGCVSWIETNLMSLALLYLYLMLNMFRMLIHPSSGACDLFVELFHGLYCSGSMCVGVRLW